MIYKYVFLAIFVSLSAMSVTLKATQNNTIITPSNERQIGLLTKYLEMRHIKYTDHFKLNQEGSFVAYVYRHKSCDGGWLITPMVRNSEGVDLFTRQATYQDYSVGSVSYMLQGDVTSTFPNRGLWIAQKINGLKQVLGFSTFRMATVFAFRPFGSCQDTLFEGMV